VDRLRGSIDRYLYRLAFPTPTQLEVTVLQSFGANSDPQRDADQIGVFEFYSRPFISVIEQNFDTPAALFFIQKIGRLGGRFVVIIDRQQ
jgi:hypothetical protein